MLVVVGDVVVYVLVVVGLALGYCGVVGEGGWVGGGMGCEWIGVVVGIFYSFLSLPCGLFYLVLIRFGFWLCQYDAYCQLW